MQTRYQHPPIHSKLTPETASQFGYKWVRDVAYDEAAPTEAMQDVLFALQDGAKLGKPAAGMLPKTFFGLYQPI